MKISDYLGRLVINLAAAKEEGIIINGILDDKLKKLSYFVIINEDNLEEIELYLPIKSILHGTDTLFVKDNKYIEQLEPKYIKCPLNARVFNTDGELLGIVKDMEFDEKGYTTKLILENGEIMQSEILIATSSIITVKGIRKIKVIRKKPIAPPEVENMMNIPEREFLSPKDDFYQYDSVNDENNPEQPPRIIADYTFLLGRIVSKNIYSYNSEVLVPANTKIDDAVVKLARNNGKLVELTINSK